jgi:uncharacterized membrane protein
VSPRHDPARNHGTANLYRVIVMRRFVNSVVSALGAGILVIAPIYLGVLLLLKIMQSLAVLVKPLARLLPDWLPAERLLSLLLVLLVCLVVGYLVRTRAGQALLGHTVFEKLPGYTLLRSLTLRIAGKADDVTWKPALAEIEEALVPAFIIEELADGRYTVFVPSVPTPLAGAVYVLAHERPRTWSLQWKTPGKVSCQIPEPPPESCGRLAAAPSRSCAPCAGRRRKRAWESCNARPYGYRRPGSPDSPQQSR